MFPIRFHQVEPVDLYNNLPTYSCSIFFLLLWSNNILLLDFESWVSLNRRSQRKSGLASNPLFILPGFSLHFPLELSYGYLWFKGNGKIPLGRQGKWKGKKRPQRKKQQNILLNLVRFEPTNLGLRDGRLNRCAIRTLILG